MCIDSMPLGGKDTGERDFVSIRLHETDAVNRDRFTSKSCCCSCQRIDLVYHNCCWRSSCSFVAESRFEELVAGAVVVAAQAVAVVAADAAAGPSEAPSAWPAAMAEGCPGACLASDQEPPLVRSAA